MQRIVPVLALALASLSAGCVSSGKYDQALADARAARQKAAATERDLRAQLAKREAELQSLQAAMRRAEERCTLTAWQLEQLQGQSLGCVKALDEATAMNQQLRGELGRLGKNVDELLTSRGARASSLDQAKARLEELRKAQAAAEARAALFRDLAKRLKRMIDAGELSIVLRSGRMVLVLPTDVLFDSGKTVIKPSGKEALTEMGRVLATLEGRRFQVAGHTDNEPIRLSGYASNWELSTERALSVVKLLIGAGMNGELVSRGLR